MRVMEQLTNKRFEFRCDKCNSKFEMTEQEMEDNNRKYEKRWMGLLIPNTGRKFNCPFCHMDRKMVCFETVYDSKRVEQIEQKS